MDSLSLCIYALLCNSFRSIYISCASRSPLYLGIPKHSSVPVSPWLRAKSVGINTCHRDSELMGQRAFTSSAMQSMNTSLMLCVRVMNPKHVLYC